MADQLSTFFLLFRLGLSLGLVMALVGGITWVLRRRGLLAGGAGRSTGRLQVLDRKSLSKHASLVVAKVGDTSVLLGVTDQSVTVLSDSDGLVSGWGESTEPSRRTVVEEVATVGSRRTGTLVGAAGAPTDPTGTGFIEALREMTVRRS